MAVDVDCYLEILRTGKWQFGGNVVPNPDFDSDPDAPESMPCPLFHSVQKELAAILTDSGNPIRSAEPYTPVVVPRGLPADLSAELAGWLQQWAGERWFATSWFTAREALGFGWTERIMRRRAMVEPQFADLFAGCPRGFPQGTPVRIAGWMRDGVEVEWLESYAEIVPDFCAAVLPQLAAAGPPDEVRLIVSASW